MEELDYLGKLYHEIAIQTKTPLSLLFSWLKRLKGDISAERKKDILSNALRQLRKLTLTYDRLALYDKQEGLVPYNPILFDISDLLEMVRHEFPSMDWERILLECDRDIPLVRGDMFQIIFCLESILSFLLRCAGEEQRIHVAAGFTDDKVFIKIRGNVPELPAEATGTETKPTARLSETLADMALGEKVIDTFINNQGGRYHSFRNGTEMEFSIELKSTSKRSLI
jgi:K+-sensing histidine kinase KdpD